MRKIFSFCSVFTWGLLTLQPALADKIKNPTAVFSGLDKITGRIISFEVAVDETVQFGALQLTPRICYSRPQTESPSTTGFLEVDEVTLDNKYRRIFTGWMFASSPGLHAVEHPIYDVWLIECKGGTEIIAEPKEASDEIAPLAQDKKSKSKAPSVAPTGRVDTLPPQGVPTQPQQTPSRRFFPNNEVPLRSGPDPTGGSR